MRVAVCLSNTGRSDHHESCFIISILPDTPDESDDNRGQKKLEESGQKSEQDVGREILRTVFEPRTGELTQDTDPGAQA